MDMIFDLNAPTALAEVPVGLGARRSFSDSAVGRLQAQLSRMTALTDLISQLETKTEIRSACQTLVDRLQEYLGAEEVLLGLCNEGSPACRLQAISQASTFNPRDERNQAAQAVLQEVIARGEPATWPLLDGSPQGGLLAHRQFSVANGNVSLCSGILRDASGQLRGAWLVTGESRVLGQEAVTSFLRLAETPVASVLQLVARAQSGRLRQAITAIKKLCHEQRGQMLFAGCIVLAAVLCLPVQYHPSCDCTVEPTTRRYVAAPFAGPLEKGLVQPGDEVQAGELLARMDGKEVRWELSGTRADLHRAGKERAGHLATHDAGQAEVARFEVDRLRIRTELLEHRDQNLEIRSPIAGIVVSGDLEDAEGMPLEVGQTLFEIAPLDEMVVELAVAEDDFTHVRPGMSVTIRLDAYPLRRFFATITRLHPRAELMEGQNVFLAEVRLQNPSGSLRPGMRGTAKIDAAPQALGWILFRRPATALITWLGW